jgi:hypothetical protein
VSLCKTPNTGLSTSGKTRLDKERMTQCQAEIVSLSFLLKGQINDIRKGFKWYGWIRLEDGPQAIHFLKNSPFHFILKL